MKQLFSPLSLLLLCWTSTFGQDTAALHFVQRNHVPINLFQNFLEHPWAGGLNAPQFSNLDLDRDGWPDLLVFERDGGRVLPFVHSGDSGAIAYTYAPAYRAAFPPLADWVLGRDYDQDGRIDLFTASAGGVQVYRNVSADSLAFAPYKGGQLLEAIIPGSDVEPILILPEDIPAFSDLDGDGDLDLLTFDAVGTLVLYYKNLSQESYGHSDSLEFILEEACWGHFQESDLSSTIILDVFCKGTATGGNLHAGSTLLTLDLDGDLDHELLLGDIGSSRLTMLTNGGTPAHADMVDANILYPASNPVNLDIFPAPFLVDVNQDGKRDLVVSPNNAGAAENTRCAWYYQNTGTDSVPIFTYFNDDLIQDEMLDVGTGAAPILVDYDRDGRMDLIVGNFGYFDDGDFVPQLMLLRNTGSDTLPYFDLITEDMGDLAFGANYLQNIYPALGDLDGDGDLDMLIGKSNGRMDFYTNNSFSPTAIFPSFSLTQADYQGIDVGGAATPQLIDISGDGLLDLIIGERDGNLNYYQNTGNGSAPVFTLVNENYGGVNVSASAFEPGYAVPWAFQHDQRWHLVVGSAAGFLHHFAGIDTQFHTPFAPGDTLMGATREGIRSAPAVADLDDDGWPDLIAGNQAGGLSYFAGQAPDTASNNPVAIAPPVPGRALRVWPNPGQGRYELSLDGPWTGGGTLTVFTPAGHRLWEQALPGTTATLDLHALPAGLYLVRFQDQAGHIAHQKLVHQPN